MPSPKKHYVVIGRAEFEENQAWPCQAATAAGARRQFMACMRKDDPERKGRQIYIETIVESEAPLRIYSDV